LALHGEDAQATIGCHEVHGQGTETWKSERNVLDRQGGSGYT